MVDLSSRTATGSADGKVLGLNRGSFATDAVNATGPRTSAMDRKPDGVPTKWDSDHLSIKLRAWGDGTQSVVIGARPGADPRTNRGAGRRLGVGVYRLVHLGSVGAYR